MAIPIHLLVLEDNPSDAELIIHELHRAGFEPDWKRVETEADFLAALAPSLDLILADYHLPQFDGLRALNLVQERKLDIPFLIVSGTIGEEIAVEAMQKGAADFLLKDRLARLGPAVKRALERKQVEEKLGASENELRALFAAMTDVVIVLDGEGRYLKIAPTNPAYLYRKPQEMLGKTIHEVLPKEQADFMIAKIGEAIRTNQTVSSEYALPIDDREIWFAGRTTRLTENSVVWVANDISERKRAEAQLVEHHATLNAILESSATPVFSIDNQYRYTSFNKAHAAVMKILYGAEIEMGHSILDYQIVPEDREISRKNIDRALLGQQFIESAYSGKPGPTRRYFEIAHNPICDPTGNVIGVSVFASDITESRQAEETLQTYSSRLAADVIERTRELQEAQEQLVRHEKMAVLGALAGGVGHELRNPLGVISNSVYYLKMVQPEANEKIKKHHALIEQEVNNAGRIVGDLLDYARNISTEPKPGSLREMVEHTLSRFPVPASIQVSLKIPADRPQVYADPLHVEQILGNLITNAWQAMATPSSHTKAGSGTLDGGGKLTIRAHQKKQLVAIAVKDTGTGITPENMQKLFEPLFSTKINGIGLGLAVSKKLAEANGGRIEVESEVGKGSTFTLYLPVMSAEVGS